MSFPGPSSGAGPSHRSKPHHYYQKKGKKKFPSKPSGPSPSSPDFLSGPASYRCALCNSSFSSLKQAEDHLIGKKHIKNAQKLGIRLVPEGEEDPIGSLSSVGKLSKSARKEAKWLEKLPARLKRNLERYRDFWLPLVKREFAEEMKSSKDRMQFGDVKRLVNRGDAIVGMQATKHKMKEYIKRSKNEVLYAFSINPAFKEGAAPKAKEDSSVDSFQLSALGIGFSAPASASAFAPRDREASWPELPNHEILPGDLIFISRYEPEKDKDREVLTRREVEKRRKQKSKEKKENSTMRSAIAKNLISLPASAAAAIQANSRAPAQSQQAAPLDINEAIAQLLQQTNGNPAELNKLSAAPAAGSVPVSAHQAQAEDSASDSGSESDSESDDDDEDEPRYIEAVCVQRNRTFLVLAVDPDSQPELFDSDSESSDSDDEADEDADEEQKAARAAAKAEKAKKAPKVLSESTRSLLNDISFNRCPLRIDRGPSKVGHDRMKEAILMITGSKFLGHEHLREIVCRLKPPEDHTNSAAKAEEKCVFDGWVEVRTRDQRSVYYYHSITGERSWNRPPPVANAAGEAVEPPILPLQDYQKLFHDSEAKRREAFQKEREHQEDFILKAEANRIHASLSEQQAVANALADMKKLNDSQRMAIFNCLSNRCSLIQGPPGTGKTTTCVALLTIWSRILKRRPILAAAYSNIGVDQLMSGMIANGLNAVRIGQIDKVTDELRDRSISVLIEKHPDSPGIKAEIETLKQLQARLNLMPIESSETNKFKKELAARWKAVRDREDKIQEEIIKNCDVVCATCIGSGYSGIGKMTFPLVVVDECTQATEPSCLIPLVQSSDSIILIGDQCQLPPQVGSESLRHSGLELSLFERMLAPVEAKKRSSDSGPADTANLPLIAGSDDTWIDSHFSYEAKTSMGIVPFLLLTQYRMHPIISSWPSQRFYGGRLLDGCSASDRRPPAGFPWPFGLPVAFVPSYDHEDGLPEDTKSNRKEAELLVMIVQSLLQAGNGSLKGSDIGIVTPYSGQVRLLRRLMHLERHNNPGRSHFSGCEISSVDGYQGREKEVILFSCVRSNPRGTVGFLSDRRRLNVAITRAKRGLIVVGNPKTLEQNATWASYMQFFHDRKLMVQQADLKKFIAAKGKAKIEENPAAIAEAKEKLVDPKSTEFAQALSNLKQNIRLPPSHQPSSAASGVLHERQFPAIPPPPEGKPPRFAPRPASAHSAGQPLHPHATSETMRRAQERRSAADEERSRLQKTLDRLTFIATQVDQKAKEKEEKMRRRMAQAGYYEQSMALQDYSFEYSDPSPPKSFGSNYMPSEEEFAMQMRMHQMQIQANAQMRKANKVPDPMQMQQTMSKQNFLSGHQNAAFQPAEQPKTQSNSFPGSMQDNFSSFGTQYQSKNSSQLNQFGQINMQANAQSNQRQNNFNSFGGQMMPNQQQMQMQSQQPNRQTNAGFSSNSNSFGSSSLPGAGLGLTPDAAALLSSLVSNDPMQLQQLQLLLQQSQSSFAPSQTQNALDALLNPSLASQFSVPNTSASIPAINHSMRGASDFSITSNSIALNGSAPAFQPKSFASSNGQAFAGGSINSLSLANGGYSSLPPGLAQQNSNFNQLSSGHAPSHSLSHAHSAAPSAAAAQSNSSMNLQFSTHSQLRHSAPSFTPKYS